jgi:hypothetical protein
MDGLRRRTVISDVKEVAVIVDEKLALTATVINCCRYFSFPHVDSKSTVR